MEFWEKTQYKKWYLLIHMKHEEAFLKSHIEKAQVPV
jgi:hypothetical protein